MKRSIAIASGVLIVLFGIMVYNLARAVHDPVTVKPGPLELGQMELHSQLEQKKKDEAQVEKQHWDSTVELRNLISGHEHRIEQLSSNHAAGEIVAYDRDSIARLEKRITDLDALAAQRAAEQALEQERAQQQQQAEEGTEPASQNP